MAGKGGGREDWGRLKGIAALAFSLAITLAILYFNPGAQVKERIGDWGYFGFFVFALATSATVILPVPGLLGALAAGSAYNFILIGAVGGMGSALGELVGYVFGYGGREALGAEKNAFYRRTREWMKGNGFVTVFVFSLVPNPLFDLAGIAAGSLGYPWWKFLLACALGKIPKFIAIAYLGSLGYQLMA